MTVRTCLIVLLTTMATAAAEPPIEPASPVADTTADGQQERIRLSLPAGLSEQSSRSELWSELLKQAEAAVRIRVIMPVL